MNLSERIRGCLESPKTATQVELELGVDAALVRGCIQSMFYSGMVSRIGGRRPYLYQAVRGPELSKRGLNLNITQQVRACIREHGPISAHGINEKTAISMRHIYSRLSELKKRKFIEMDANGCYVFLRESKNPPILTPDERKQKAKEADARRRRRQKAMKKPVRHEKCAPLTVVKDKQPVKVAAPCKPMTVDEWIANGGVIDRSPTPLPFERLSRDDIDTSYRARSTVMARTARSYLAG